MSKSPAPSWKSSDNNLQSSSNVSSSQKTAPPPPPPPPMRRDSQPMMNKSASEASATTSSDSAPRYPPFPMNASTSIKPVPVAKGSSTASLKAPPCTLCNDVVYKMEELSAINQTWHKTCFKCGGKASDGCKKVLTLDKYMEHDQNPYCEGCYNKLFRPKGFGYSNTLTGSSNDLQAVDAKSAIPSPSSNRTTSPIPSPIAKPAAPSRPAGSALPISPTGNIIPSTHKEYIPPSTSTPAPTVVRSEPVKSPKVIDQSTKSSPAPASAPAPPSRLPGSTLTFSSSGNIIPSTHKEYIPPSTSASTSFSPPPSVKSPKAIEEPVKSFPAASSVPPPPPRLPGSSLAISTTGNIIPSTHKEYVPPSASSASISLPPPPMIPKSESVRSPKAVEDPKPSPVSESRPGFTTTTSSKKLAVGGALAPKCTVCAKSVYKMEEAIAVGRTWHKACFTCGGTAGDGCGRGLTLDKYLDHENQPYCNACYARLFKPKGFGYGTNLQTDYGLSPEEQVEQAKRVLKS